MSIYIFNNKRINILSPVIYKGVQYNNLLKEEDRLTMGVEEIPEPPKPENFSLDTHNILEIVDPPFIIYQEKPTEEIQTLQKTRAKFARSDAIDRLKVTTAAGNEFDADETSQNRMSRAITGMAESDTLPWVLANNNIIQVTKLELLEALKLAGIAMATEWLKPYQ